MSSTPARVQAAPSLGEALKGSPELYQALSAALLRNDVAIVEAADFKLGSVSKPRTPGFR